MLPVRNENAPTGDGFLKISFQNDAEKKRSCFWMTKKNGGKMTVQTRVKC